MKKWIKVLLSLSIGFSLWACTSKTTVTLSSVSFASFYLGDLKNPTEPDRIPLKSEESTVISTALDLAHWTSIQPDQAGLEPVGAILIDQDERRYELFQDLDQIVIKVTQGGSSPVYFETSGSASSLIALVFKPIRTAIQNRKALIQATPISVDTDVSLNSDKTKFSLTKIQSEKLMAILKIWNWNATQTSVIDDTPHGYFIINLNEKGDRLVIHPQETHAVINYLQIIGGKSQISSYTLDLSACAFIQSTLNQWLAIRTRYSDPMSLNFVFDQAKFPMNGVSPGVLESNYFQLSLEESEQAKKSLEIEKWLLLNTNPELTWTAMTLTDDQKLVYTFGFSVNESVVQITDPNDPSFMVTCKIPDKLFSMTRAFLNYWDGAQVTQAIRDFIPVNLVIDPNNAQTSRQIALSASEAQKLMNRLKLDTWRLDPDPTKYAFGWDPEFVLDNGEGTSFSIYHYVAGEVMAIAVKEPYPVSEHWVWYITSDSYLKDFEATIKALYPEP